MNRGNASLRVGENDVERNQRVEHPKAQRLSGLKEKQHTPIRRQRGTFHEAARAGLAPRRQLGINDQEHYPCAGAYHLYTGTGQVGRVQLRQADV
jgi:hypothetical protein